MRVLVLAPHTDDAELGCGGTIAKLAAGGAKMWVVSFSTGTASKEEAIDAVTALGETVMTNVFEYETRRFPYNRVAILEQMAVLRNKYQPTRVYTPSRSDTHQDHQVVHDEAVRAFKGVTILGYQMPWNQADISVQMLVGLTDAQWERKLAALDCYKSQHGRRSWSIEAVNGLGRLCGHLAGAPWGESFEVVRWYE